MCRWYRSNGRKQRGTKEPLDDGEGESEKAILKLHIQKTKIMASGLISSWQIGGGKMEVMTHLIFFGSKIIVMVTAAMKLKDAYSLEGKLWQT